MPFILNNGTNAAASRTGGTNANAEAQPASAGGQQVQGNEPVIGETVMADGLKGRVVEVDPDMPISTVLWDDGRKTIVFNSELEGLRAEAAAAEQRQVQDDDAAWDELMRQSAERAMADPGGVVVGQQPVRASDGGGQQTGAREAAEAQEEAQPVGKGANRENDVDFNAVIDRARAGEQQQAQLREYGLDWGKKGVYRFAAEGEVNDILAGGRYDGRHGDGRVDATNSDTPTTASTAEYRITFKDGFDFNKTGTAEADRAVVKNAELGDGYITGGYTLDDVAMIERRKDDGTYETVYDAQQGTVRAGEQQQAEGEQQPSAYERIPKDAQGNPLYEQADADTAWDAIVEQTKGDEQMAQNVASSMVADKEAELKKIEKSKPKGGVSVAEKIAAEQERKAAVEEAQRQVDIWKRIADTPARRKTAQEAERKRAEEEEARRKRAEQEAAEQRRKEQEAAERAAQEALNGVPDIVDDTPQDARARGYRSVNGHRVDRQEPLAAVRGKAVQVKFDDKNIPDGHVALIEAGQLQPSHIDGQRNPSHFIDEAQPKERTDEASVMQARKIAGNIRPEEITSSATAYTGAPTVNVRGEVIQGNNRSAALREMWESHPEQARKYKQYLMDHAAELGLRAEDVGAMQQPVLVNMLDVNDEEAVKLGQFVAQDTESGGVERIKPKNMVGKMGGNMGTYARMLLETTDDEMSFSELVDRNGTRVLKWMQEKGYITATQYRSAFDSKGNLTAEAKNDLKGIMYQSIFQNGNTHLEEMFNKLPAKAQKAILATAYRDHDSPAAERMIEEIQKSIMAYHALSEDASFASAKNYKDARRAAEAWKKQFVFDFATGESYLPAERYSNFALLLAAMYKGQTQKFMQDTFSHIYDLVQGTQQATLFEEPDNTPRTLAEAINEAINARGGQLMLNGKFEYDGQRRSDVLGGGAEAGQRGKQGGTGGAAARGRTEDGNGAADSGRGTVSTDRAVPTDAGREGRQDNQEEGERVAPAQEAAAVPVRQEGEDLFAYAERVAKAGEIRLRRKEVEQNPTEGQKEAGNYRKGHVKIDGHDVTIENPKGSVRSGKDANGTEWSVTMNNDYGYIRGTEGVDGDHIDVFLSEDPTLGDVYVVDQVNPDTGEFDEHKVMYGFNSVEEAREAYMANYSPGWKGLGAITRVSKEEFGKWVKSSHRKTKPFAEYKSVNKEAPTELTRGEALAIIADMEEHAEVAPEMELTIENWNAEFGEDGRVNTPIGEVKMGENQFTKMMRQGRNGKLGMVKPTLENPDIIVKDSSEAKEGDTTERGSSYVFVKAFIKPDGSRYYYFTSVTVNKEGHEVVVSNQEKRRNVLTNLLMKGKLVWKHADNASAASDVADGLYSSQGNVSDPTTEGTDAPQTNYSGSKGSEKTPITSESGGKEARAEANQRVGTQRNGNIYQVYERTDSKGKTIYLVSGERYDEETGRRVPKEFSDNSDYDGYGDAIFRTREAAEAEARRMLSDYNEQQRQQSEERKRAEEAERERERAEQERNERYGEMYQRATPLRKAAIAKALEKKVRINGESKSVADFIAGWLRAGTLRVEQGQKPKRKFDRRKFNRMSAAEQKEYEKSLEETQTVYLVNGTDLGKTAYDYAQQLLNESKAKASETGQTRQAAEQSAGQDLAAEAHEVFSDMISQSAHKVEIADENVTEKSTTLYAPIKVDGKETNLSLFQEEPVRSNEEPIVGVSYYRDGLTYQEASDLSEEYNKHVGREVCRDGSDELAINFSNIDEAVKFENWLGKRNTVDDNRRKGEKGAAEQRRDAGAEQAEDFAERHNLDAGDVASYADYMSRGNLNGASGAFTDIRRKARIDNAGASLGEFAKIFSPIRKELYEKFGNLEELRERYVQAEMDERNMMEAARKRAEEAAEAERKRLQTFQDMTDEQLDEEYFKALEANDEQRMRDLVNEAARRNGYGDVNSEYQGVGAWSAPGNPGYRSDAERRAAVENDAPDVNVTDIANGYLQQPADYFTNLRAYGNDTQHGRESGKAIKAAMEEVRNGKDPMVKVYRAVPKTVKEGKLRNGDWVTPSRKYAEMHGNNRLEGDYRMIEQEVPASQLWWDGNDINEWGFDDGKGYAYRNTRNNRKLNDLITRDDDGNVIPLSQRFNARKADVRYRFIGEQGAARLDAAEEATVRLDNLATARQMEQAYNDKKARIEKLRNSEPVEITGKEIEPSDDLKQYRKNALEYGKKLQGEYTNKDTGRTIQLQRGRRNGGLKEVLQHDVNDVAHIASVAAIPQIIENAVYIDSADNHDTKKNPNVSKYHYYVCGLRIGDNDYTVRMVEAEEKDGSRYYDHKLTHIEKGNLIDNIETAFNKTSSTELSSTPGTGAEERNRPTNRGEIQAAPISGIKDRVLVSLLQTNDRENARKIKLATGWERGADGKWRREGETEAQGGMEANERFNGELERYRKGEMGKNDMFHLGMPQGVMRMFLPDLPIVMRQRVVKKGSEKKHNVPISAIKDMPQMISEPIFVFQRDGNTIGILTEMRDANGKNVCVAIELGKNIQGDGKAQLEVNDIRSFHGREIKYVVEPIVYNGTLRYADKKKGLAWLSSASQPVQQEIDKQDLDAAANIVRNFENPSVTEGNRQIGNSQLSALL